MVVNLWEYLVVAIERRMVHFKSEDRGEAEAELARIADASESHDQGRAEWLTFSPWVDPQDLPVTSLLRRIFSGRGSKVPEVTWVPAQGGEPAQLGILHATGPRALQKLKESGVSIPDQLRVISDHSKRGLLFGIHPNTAASTVVNFAIRSAEALSEVPTDNRWMLEVSTAS